MASCGVIIYNTHFAVANACNALSNGWSKKSRCERYTAGSVIRRDRLTRLAPSHRQGGKVTANGARERFTRDSLEPHEPSETNVPVFTLSTSLKRTRKLIGQFLSNSFFHVWLFHHARPMLNHARNA